LHIGFDRAATEAGYRDNGPPRERPVYHTGYYGAFVLYADGNNIEVVKPQSAMKRSGERGGPQRPQARR
jgi:hypothetical protein